MNKIDFNLLDKISNQPTAHAARTVTFLMEVRDAAVIEQLKAVFPEFVAQDMMSTTLFTAKARICDVVDIAAFEDVVYMEGGKPMYPQ
jgi:hypothetical protein